MALHSKLPGWLSVPMLSGLLALTACSTPLDGMPVFSSTEAPVYRVDAGDTLRITVQDLAGSSGDFIVDDTGNISLPLLSPMLVRGMSYREIESSIATALLNDGILQNPAVNVQPVTLRPYYVLGEVNSPGEFSYRQGMTVLSALAAAGGYTYRAQTGEVSITRKMDGKLVTARADERTVVLPGDSIRVYERWF